MEHTLTMGVNAITWFTKIWQKLRRGHIPDIYTWDNSQVEFLQ